jgi:hypothetical protein
MSDVGPVGKVALTERIARYVDESQRFVDISKCIPGAHARAIKPGGKLLVKNSILEDGYKRVSTLPLIPLLVSGLQVHGSHPP